jgi:hypothetical protein
LARGTFALFTKDSPSPSENNSRHVVLRHFGQVEDCVH